MKGKVDKRDIVNVGQIWGFNNDFEVAIEVFIITNNESKGFLLLITY